MNPLHFSRNVRTLNRLRQIAMVMTRHGFGHVVSRLHLGRFVPVWMFKRRGGADRKASNRNAGIGTRIASVATDLGPTFVKLGQTLSTRVDLLPQSVINELKSLQDQVPPFDNDQAMTIIAEELGRPVLECFGSIESAPFASASIGQVYRATSRSGRPLVVKVRRPDIEDTIRLDMQLSHTLAQSLEAMMPETRIYRPKIIVAEFEQTLMRELDYINEAAVTARFHQFFECDGAIHIAKVHWELSGPRVLTMEALPGESMSNFLTTEEEGRTHPKIDRQLLAKRLADCFLRQVFDLGIFHCDPHPGNMLVEENGTLGLLDFGQVGYMTPEWMTQLVVMVYAGMRREVEVIVDTFADMGTFGPDVDQRALRRALQVLLDKYYGLPIKRFDLGVLLNEFSDVVRRHDVILPRDMILLIKSFSVVTSVTSQLDPDFDLLALIEPRLKKTMSQRFSRASIAHEASLTGWHIFSAFRQGPKQIRQLLRRIGTGGWQLKVQHENIDRLANELDRSSNRIAFSVVIAAIIIGSSVVISAKTDQTIPFLGAPIQILGLVGYIVAGVMGIGLTWAIYRSGRLH